MERKRIYRKIIAVIMLILGLTMMGVTCEAATVAGNFSDITKYSGVEGGYSYPGIKVYVDGCLRAYASDTWKREGGIWKYVSSQINGKTLTTNTYTDSASNIIMPFASTSSSRCILKAGQIDGIAEYYSVVLSKYEKGVKKSTTVEYSDDIHAQANLGGLSFCNAYAKKSSVGCGNYGADSASYVFQVYNAKSIAPGSNEFALELNGGGLQSAGMVCYDGEKYSIRKLPEVQKNRVGYHVAFDGWYDSSTGGKKYETGDLIPLGSRFYARWIETPNEYSVTCVDMVSEDGTEEILGSHTWNATYGTVVSGSDIGTDSRDSVYYKGYSYHDDTKAEVTVAGATVYRYFKRSQYPVHYIDKVMEGKENGKILNDYQSTKKYKDVIDGMDQGNDMSEGAYYRGYMFVSSTAEIVIGENCTVYRYFKPVRYRIRFEGSGSTSGAMKDMEECEYLSEITLPKNIYQRQITTKLHLNSDDAVCDSEECKFQAVFKGWSRTMDGDAEFADGSVVSHLVGGDGEEVVLYAVWAYEEQKITAVPKRMGYQFSGWSLQPEDTSGNVSFQLEKDTDLYAIWKPDIVKYNVEYYKEKLDGSYELSAQYQFEGYTDKEVSITSNAEIYQGYSLDKASSILEGKVKGDGSLVLSAYYSRNIYEVTFDVNKGISEDNIDETRIKNKYGAEYVIPEYTATRYGYRFAGWSMEKENYHRIYQSGDTFMIQNHDVILYAAWLPTNYKVHFDANIPEDCQVSDNQLMGEQSIAFDCETLLQSCSYKAPGYRFAGWCTKSNGMAKIYQENNLVKNLTTAEYGEVTMYAIWRPVSFLIQYNAGATPDNMEAKGQIADTSYQYDKDSFASTQRFKINGYHLKCWNTKKDGTGSSIAPGENLKGKYLGEENITLYAIWEADDDTVFQVEIRKGDTDSSITLDNLTLSGTTGQTIASALEEIYNDSLHGEGASYFYKGYKVQNEEELQTKISGDSSLQVVLYVKERDCTITYYRMENDREVAVAKATCSYQEEIRLPETVGDSGRTKRYIDQNDNIYSPGQTITVSTNIKLYIQHLICFRGVSDKMEYVTGGKSIVFPEVTREGYQLEGWYKEEGLKNLAGKTGQKSDALYDSCTFYAKWSGPQKYKITYDIDRSKITILEHNMTEHTFGSETVLPDASQVAVSEGYIFMGWYDAKDITHSIIRVIGANEAEDKVLCAFLVRKDISDTTDLNAGTTPPQYNDANDSTYNTVNPSSDVIVWQNNKTDTSQNKTTEIGNGELKKTILAGNITYVLNDGDRKLSVKKIKNKKKKVVIPSKIRYQNQTYTVTAIADKVMCHCKTVKEIIIPDSVTEIGNRAFYHNQNLVKVTLGKKIRRIGREVFANANKMAKIKIKGSQLKRIGNKIVSNGKKAIVVTGKNTKKKAYLKLLKHSNSKIRWAYKKM